MRRNWKTMTSELLLMRRSVPLCSTPRCGRPARRIPSRGTLRLTPGPRCEACRRRANRHGHVHQTALRWKDVRPYVLEVRKLCERGNLELIERSLREIHSGLLDFARTTARQEHRGVATPRNTVLAADELERVLSAVTPWESGAVVAAMSLLQDQDRFAFRSDRAWRFQTVRM